MATRAMMWTMCFILPLRERMPCRGPAAPIGLREVTSISKRASRSWEILWCPRLEGRVQGVIHRDLIQPGLVQLGLNYLAPFPQASLVTPAVTVAMGGLEGRAMAELAITQTKTVSGQATALVQAVGATTTAQVRWRVSIAFALRHSRRSGLGVQVYFIRPSFFLSDYYELPVLSMCRRPFVRIQHNCRLSINMGYTEKKNLQVKLAVYSPVRHLGSDLVQ